LVGRRGVARAPLAATKGQVSFNYRKSNELRPPRRIPAKKRPAKLRRHTIIVEIGENVGEDRARCETCREKGRREGDREISSDRITLVVISPFFSMRLQARGYHYPRLSSINYEVRRPLARKFDASLRSADDFVTPSQFQINNIERITLVRTNRRNETHTLGVRKATARARSAVTAVARYVTRHVKKNENPRSAISDPSHLDLVSHIAFLFFYVGRYEQRLV